MRIEIEVCRDCGCETCECGNRNYVRVWHDTGEETGYD